MKNLSIVFNLVLLVAVGVLYVLHFSGENEKQTKNNTSVERTVVYINTDSLLANYKLSIELNENFLKKQEGSRADFNFKAKKLEREAADFKRKLQNGGFLSRERAEKAQRKLMEKQQNLQILDRKLSNELMSEQSSISERLYDKITSYLTEYNKTKNYNLILSTTKGGTVLYSEDAFDITKEVLKGLNSEISTVK